MKRVALFIGLTTAVLLLLGLSVFATQAAPTQQQDRQVIKDGELVLMVTDTETAVNNALSLLRTFDGYVLEQRSWQNRSGFQFAVIEMGVPQESFSSLMLALKPLGMLQDESVNGEDVTNQAVDLRSRLDNLHENQRRLRGFLEQARTVTETLQIHQELTAIEAEVGSIEGDGRYINGRSAAATLSLRLNPFIPTPTPSLTPTPTPTATPTPLPTAAVWRPGDTAKVASVQLQDTAQATADASLYFLIAWLPPLLFWSVILYIVWRIVLWVLRRTTLGQH
ncbi:MAG: DUF4349 domain-containing protein [Chloroflexota bacterium]